MFNRIEISIIRRYNSTYLLQLSISVIRVSDDPRTDDTKVVQSAIIPQWSNKRKLVILSISRTNGMWLLMVWLVEPFFAICGYLLLFYFESVKKNSKIHYFFPNLLKTKYIRQTLSSDYSKTQVLLKGFSSRKLP